MISQKITLRPPVLLESSGWLDDILIRICVALQLTQTQYEEAATHYRAVAKWLAAPQSPLAAIPQEIFPQGSLRIGTTVRPWTREEYDLDLVLQLELHGAIDPIHLLNSVQNRLLASDRYAGLVERKNRCVRLNFAKQFHLDVLPARPDLRFGGTHVLVPDCDARCWKESNPKGYASWFEGRGELMQLAPLIELKSVVRPLPVPEEAADKNALQLATQLLKRWRDILFAGEPEMAPISIVLTTLAGTYYSGESTPLSAIRSIVRGINLSIPTVGRLKVVNPANPLEDLSERWDTNPEAYRFFVRAMRLLEAQLQELSTAQGLSSKVRLFEALFGEPVVKKVVIEEAAAVEAIRRTKDLAVARTGALTLVTSTKSMPVRSNTYYGS